MAKKKVYKEGNKETSFVSIVIYGIFIMIFTYLYIFVRFLYAICQEWINEEGKKGDFCMHLAVKFMDE